jgi:hypothetical protein
MSQEEYLEKARAVMNRIERLPLPERTDTWQCIIQVEIKDVNVEDGLIFQWLVSNGQLRIEEGTVHKPDYLVRFKGLKGIKYDVVRFCKANGQGTMFNVANKWGAIIKTIRRNPEIMTIVDEMAEEEKARELDEKAQSYQSPSQCVDRIVSYALLRILPLSVGAIIADQVIWSDNEDNTFLIALVIVIIGALLLKIIGEAYNYQRYHQA